VLFRHLTARLGQGTCGMLLGRPQHTGFELTLHITLELCPCPSHYSLHLTTKSPVHQQRQWISYNCRFYRTLSINSKIYNFT